MLEVPAEGRKKTGDENGKLREELETTICTLHSVRSNMEWHI